MLDGKILDGAGSNIGGIVSSVGNLINNAQSSFPALFTLGFVFCYAVGPLIAINGIFGLKAKSSGQQVKVDPIAQILIGVLLFYVPSWMSSVGSTLFGSYINPLDYNISGSDKSTLLAPTMWLIKLIGFYAFIKGTMILRYVGSNGNRSEDALSKGIIHCVGGVAVFHMEGTLAILSSTFGLGNVKFIQTILGN